MTMNAKRYIPISSPSIGPKETEYVMDCMTTTWVSSVGKYIDRFEEAFAKVAGAKHAVACSNGTTALHLALLALGVKPGDEVLVPTLTFIACANSVVYCGATPVLVDIDPEIWSIDPAQIEALITPKTRGILAVHLRGHPADMNALMTIARNHGLFVLEDAAQAHGAEVNGKRVGSIGDIATFSFFGNKMITTGEGGMVTTNDDKMADYMRLLKNQGMTKEHRYWHPVIGYNYRMTNIQAAIGLAQTERIADLAAGHQRVSAWYREGLANAEGIVWQKQRPWAKHVWWQFVVLLDEKFAPDRDAVLAKLQAAGVDARRLYYPTHQLPPYQASVGDRKFPVADYNAARGICLPTWSGLKEEDVKYVCAELLKCRR